MTPGPDRPVTRYLTVACQADAEIVARGSRFCCRVTRVPDKAAALEQVQLARRRHWRARHHCSAFVVGADSAGVRSSDDGEPSGTAGAPMLEVLRGRHLTDVVAVVSRYFGGTLLGAGGLVRAYSEATRAALDGAGAVERRLLQLVEVTVPLDESGRLEHALRSRGITVAGVDYPDSPGRSAILRLAVSVGAAERFGELVTGLTKGAATTRLGDTDWVDVPAGRH